MPILGVERKNACAPGDPMRDRGFLGRRARSLVIRTLAAVTVAFLWFAPYLCTFFEERTRCLSRWQVRDALVLLGPLIEFALRQEGGDLQGARRVVEAAAAKGKRQSGGQVSTSRGKDAYNDSPMTRRTTHYVGTHVRIH